MSLCPIHEFERHIKPKADSTLRNMRKDALIAYIRCLENNYNAAVSFNENQARYIEPLGLPISWIPVSVRLPRTIPCGAGTEYSEAVNVLTSGRKVLTAIFDGKEFIADAEFWEAEGEMITHWIPIFLPLPEPPEED